MNEENTVKVVEIKLDLSPSTIRNRSIKLKLESHYAGPAGNQHRYWTDEEIELIKNWRGEKPGVKRK